MKRKRSRREGNRPRRKPRGSQSTNSRSLGFIQVNDQVDDGAGGYTDDWENAHPNPHWMSIIPKASLQVLEHETVNAEVTHVIELRFAIPVVDTNRIVSVKKVDEDWVIDVVYEILSVENIQNRDVMNMVFCKERRK